MNEHPLRARWRASKAVLNGWLRIPSGFTAEVMARQGWDSLTIDMQHGLMHYESAVECLRAIATTGVTPLVRVPWNEPGIIMKMIDSGAFGVICPMVNDRREAEAFVGACRYPPAGFRSFGPIRSGLIAGPDYVENGAELVVTLAMIETREGLENVDDILATPGLDGIYIGPADLGFGLGFQPRMDPTEPAVLDAIGHILARAHAHERVAGMHTGAPSYARGVLERGFDLVTVGSDDRLLAEGARAAVKAVGREA